MMRVVCVPAGLLVGLLFAGSVQAAACAAPQSTAVQDTAVQTTAAQVAAVAPPAADPVCRDEALAAATRAVDEALAALGATTDESGRVAISAGQTLWRLRLDDLCPVTAAELAADPTAATAVKSRAECLLRVTSARVAGLEAQRAARVRPVADLPLTITDAAAPRLVEISARPVAQTRPVSMLAMAGRWGKADPVEGTPVDDCRTSFLDITRDQTVRLVDLRVPAFPIQGRLSVEADPVSGVDLLVADAGSAGNPAAGRGGDSAS